MGNHPHTPPPKGMGKRFWAPHINWRLSPHKKKGGAPEKRVSPPGIIPP